MKTTSPLGPLAGHRLSQDTNLFQGFVSPEFF